MRLLISQRAATTSQGVSPAITVGNKMDTIIWILESSSLGQAGNNIEALALNEIIKEIMNSVYDKQKHPTEQNNPRSKCFCPGGYLYEPGTNLLTTTIASGSRNLSKTLQVVLSINLSLRKLILL